MFNIDKALDKDYKDKSLKEILLAPVSAISGVSEKDAEALNAAFGIKTVADLANSKYFQWARAISFLADVEK